MATLVSDIEMETINVDLAQSESERRDGARLLSNGDWIARADGGYAITYHDDCTSMLRDKRWFSALALISQMQNYVNEECAKRDYKNIYSSFDDTDKCLPGYTEPYETSKLPELILDTENNSIEDCKKMLLQKVLEFCNTSTFSPDGEKTSITNGLLVFWRPES